MMDDPPASANEEGPFHGLLGAVAAELDGVRRQPAPDAPGWQEHHRGGTQEHHRGGTLFARVADRVLEVKLPGDIAEAALRTPDTSTPPGRPGWVRFAPASGERHVRDRAEAWYRTAWRHAAGPRGDEAKG